MANDVVTLTELLGKPEFQPVQRMERDSEAAIMAHVRSRRSEGHFPLTTDDLTTLIEKHADELDIYADLGEYGAGVEGLTLFQPRLKPLVKISGQLSESSNENRLRSTLAHEFGHVLLHDPLFQRKSQDSLFNSDRRYLQVCYRDEEGKPTVGDLFEYQAWFVCGAILMPMSELSAKVSQLAEAHDHYSEIWQYSDLGSEIVAEAARGFGVSSQLARIRLLKSGLLSENEPSPALF